jgi:vacuolar-type H+-ATPase subunit H
MKPVRPQNLDDSSDDAINQVLAAEQQAREALVRARETANARLADARVRSLRIEQRADERAGRLRAACQHWVARRSAELNREAQALRDAPAQDTARQARLAEAVTRLAAELGGGEST